MELQVLRDESRPYATCPNCQSRLELPGLNGMTWTIRSPNDIADRLMIEMSGLEQEQLRVVILDTKNHVLRVVTAYQGNVSSIQCRVGELFRDAVRLNAAGVVLVDKPSIRGPDAEPG